MTHMTEPGVRGAASASTALSPAGQTPAATAATATELPLAHPEAVRVYRRPQVERMVGLSRSTLYAMMAEGTFPQPVRLGRRAVGWRAADLSAWIAARETGTAS